MSSKKIENGRYWNSAWQLIDGCTPCSPGCDHCWSESMTHRFTHPNNDSHIHDGLLTDDSGKFTGTIYTYPDRLTIPLKRRKPTVYAVWNDLFHEDVSPYFVTDAYHIMEQTYQHTYLVLTKRPSSMLYNVLDNVKSHEYYSHIWHGLTVCNQAEADEKIPVFLKVPGRKFLSIEPCLSHIDLDATCGSSWCWRDGSVQSVILGGETLGKNSGREMKIGWAESIVAQCDAAGVPVFVKQIHLNGKVSKDMNEWPEKLRRRELPWRNGNGKEAYIRTL